MISDPFINDLKNKNILDSEVNLIENKITYSSLKVAPSIAFTEFISHEQPFYSRDQQEMNKKISLIELHKNASRPKEDLYLVGSNMLFALGYKAVIQLLSQMKVGKKKTLYKILNPSIVDFIKWRCSKEGNDYDFRVEKKELSKFSDLQRLDTCFEKKLNVDRKWFKDHFYCTRFKKDKFQEKEQWCIQSFYYGKDKKRIEWVQELSFKRNFIFYESAFKLKILSGGKEVELIAPAKVDLVACFLDHLFGVLKIPKEGIREAKDFEMLICRQSYFMRTMRPFEEEELLKLVQDSYTLIFLLKDAFEKHSDGSKSALLALLLNALRVYQTEEGKVVQEFIERDLLSEKELWIELLFEMLKNKIPYATIAAYVQVAVGMKLISYRPCQHNGADYIQIGDKHSILFRLEKNACETTLESFEQLLPYFEKLFVSKQKGEFFQVYIQHIYQKAELVFKIDPNLPLQKKLNRYIECLKSGLKGYHPLLTEIKKLLLSEQKLTTERFKIPFSVFKLFASDPQADEIYKKVVQLRLVEISRELNDIWSSIFQHKKEKMQLKEVYEFWKKEWNFHKSKNLALDAINQSAVELFNELKKEKIMDCAIELRSLFKKDLKIQNQMVIDVLKKEVKVVQIIKIESKKIESLKIESLNELLGKKKPQLVEVDALIAELITNSSPSSLRSIQWGKLQVHLPRLKQSLIAFEKRIELFVQEVESVADFTIINCSSKAKSLFFQCALYLLEKDVMFSHQAFEKMVHCKSKEKFEKDLTSLILAYREPKTKLWLFGLKNLSLLQRTFDVPLDVLLDINLDVCDGNKKELIYSKIKGCQESVISNVRVQLAITLKDVKKMFDELEIIIERKQWGLSFKPFIDLLNKLMRLKFHCNDRLKEKIYFSFENVAQYLDRSKEWSVLLFFIVDYVQQSNFTQKIKSCKAGYTLIDGLAMRCFLEKNNPSLSKKRLEEVRRKIITYLQVSLKQGTEQTKEKACELMCKNLFLELFPLEDSSFFQFYRPCFPMLLRASLVESWNNVYLWKDFLNRALIHFDEKVEEEILTSLAEIFIFCISTPRSIQDVLYSFKNYNICREIYFNSSIGDNLKLFSFLMSAVNNFAVSSNNLKEKDFQFALLELLKFSYQEMQKIIELKEGREGCLKLCYQWISVQLHFEEPANAYFWNLLIGLLKTNDKLDKNNTHAISLALITQAVRKIQYTKNLHCHISKNELFIDHETKFLATVDKQLLRETMIGQIKALRCYKSNLATLLAGSIFYHGIQEVTSSNNWLDEVNSFWFSNLEEGDFLEICSQAEQQFCLGNQILMDCGDDLKAVDVGHQLILSALKHANQLLARTTQKKDRGSGLTLIMEKYHDLSFFDMQSAVINYKKCNLHEELLALIDSYADFIVLFYIHLGEKAINFIYNERNIDLSTYFSAFLKLFENLLSYVEEFPEEKMQLRNKSINFWLIKFCTLPLVDKKFKQDLLSLLRKK